MFEGNNGEIEIPTTITPGAVWKWNIILLSVIVLVLLPLLGLLWAIILIGLGLAGAVTFGLIAVEIVDFHGALLFNPLDKTRRVIFPGLHLKLPWESLEEGSQESLRRIVSSTGLENLPTNDPAENMQVHLTVHKRLNVSGTKDKPMKPEDAAVNFIRFHSIAVESLTTIVRKEIVKMFSEHYANREMEKLLDAKAIQDTVFPVAGEGANNAKIKEMETRWGVLIGVVLDASNADEATKQMKRTPARAEGLTTAINTLKTSGLNAEQARGAALSLDETADYSEKKYRLEIDAPDLKNLTHVSIMPGAFGDDKKKGGKK